MITIHQAIYGEKSGHALINSTDNGKFTSRISGYTDLADRPEGGVLLTSIIRGIWVDSNFLLIKTFPDLSPGMRSGRVFSHVLVISKDDIHQINDISELFQFHLSAIDKGVSLEPIQYRPSTKNTISAAIKGREAVAINALVEHANYTNCIAWLNEDGYWLWITRIWAQLPKKVKESVRLGAAFDPQRIKPEELSLVYVPLERQTTWARHTFKIVGLLDSENLEGPVSEWLAKGSEKESVLYTLLSDFSPKIESIEDVQLLYNLGKVYLSIPGEPKLSDLLVFSHHISEISKKDGEGSLGKRKLLKAVLKLIPDTNSSMIQALMYQSWTGFSGAIGSITPPVTFWLEKKLFEDNQSDNQGAIVLQAVEVEKENWWSKIIKTHLAQKLEQSTDKDMAVIWGWILKFPNLAVKHQLWLPHSMEMLLVSKVPKFPQEAIENLLKMAKEKEWFILHGVILSKHYTAKEALIQQLEIDKDQNHSSALLTMSKHLKEVAFVDASVSLNDVRLYQISGKIVKDTPSLKKALNIQDQSWILIWKESIAQGGNIWDGIQSPKNVLFGIMDLLKDGKGFDEALLIDLSENTRITIKEYSYRETIWEKLPVTSRSGFAEATLFDCIDDIITGKLRFSGLDPFLMNLFQSEPILEKIINTPSISNKNKIKLFNHTTILHERHAKKILEKTLNNEEAKLLGQLIKNRNWKILAEYTYQNYTHRADLRSVITECSDLLGLLQRFNLKINGVKPNSINIDDWWDLFSETAIRLYPEGPNQNGLWSNAGGNVADLLLKTNGRKSWGDAIDHLIKEGSKPIITKLLEEMRKEFRQNDTLNMLYQTK